MSREEVGMANLWNSAFRAAIRDQSYNLAPPEALVRNVSYYLRARYKPEEFGNLSALDMGCGAGATMEWLLRKGIGMVVGIDISPVCLQLAKERLPTQGYYGLHRDNVTSVRLANEKYDIIVEANVFQHLAKEDRGKAFAEVYRLLKPGGLFAGYMESTGSSVFLKNRANQLPEDHGTIILQDSKSKEYELGAIGLCHFFSLGEICEYLKEFTVVDPSIVSYFLPQEEANRRGYLELGQMFWAVYAIK